MKGSKKTKICFIHSHNSYLQNFNLFPEEEKSSLEIYSVLEEYTSKSFDLLKTYERSKEIILANNIDVVIAPEEILHLVSAVLEQTAIEKTSFDFTKVQAEFFCDHKYYTRKYLDINTCPYSYLLTDSNLTKETILKAVQEAGGFPVFIKPFFGYNSMFQGKANSVEDVLKIVNKYEKEVPPLFSKGIFPFFEKFVDLKKYPLFIKKGMIVEKLIDFKYLPWVEGCIMNNKFHIVTIGDDHFDKEDAKIFTYCYFPSLLPKKILNELTEIIEKIGKNMLFYGMNNKYFNMEFMITEKNEIVLQEINGRISGDSYHMLMKGAINGNMYYNLIRMQNNENVEIPKIIDNTLTTIFYFYANKKQIETLNFDSFKQYEIEPYLPKDEIPEFFFLDEKTIIGEKIAIFRTFEEIVSNFELINKKLIPEN